MDNSSLNLRFITAFLLLLVGTLYTIEGQAFIWKMGFRPHDQKRMVLAKEEIRKFLDMAERVQGEEIRLYANEQMADLQEFPLRYQGRVGQRIQPTRTALLERKLKKKHIENLAALLQSAQWQFTNLLPMVKLQIVLHRQMIPENMDCFDKSYAERIHKSFQSMAPDSQGSIQDFVVSGCDYTGQGTNFLWFNLTLARLVHELGLSVYGPEWEKELQRQEIEFLAGQWAQEMEEGWPYHPVRERSAEYRCDRY